MSTGRWGAATPTVPAMTRDDDRRTVRDRRRGRREHRERRSTAPSPGASRTRRAATSAPSPAASATRRAASFSTVAGGLDNTASGPFSFAAGAWRPSRCQRLFRVRQLVRSAVAVRASARPMSRASSSITGCRWTTSRAVPTAAAPAGSRSATPFAGQTIATWTGAFLSDAGVWVNAASSREVKDRVRPGRCPRDPRQGRGAADQHLALPGRRRRRASHRADGRGLPRRVRRGLRSAHHRRSGCARRCARRDPGAEREAGSGRARRMPRSRRCVRELAAIRSVLATIAASQPTQTAVVGP